MKIKSEILRRLVEPGVIAIIRADSSTHLMHVAEALRKGGIIAMEITMTTPNAIELIQEVTRRHGDDIVMGVGSILDTETCRAAILAGAEFVVTPVLRPEVIQLCRRYARPIICGAYTPTEILTAWECGSDFVKVFPADSLGPNYIKSVKAPLPQVEIIPTGGVDVATVADFIKAGCAAVAVSSNLVSKKIVETQNWEELTATARRFVEAVAKARAK